MAKLWLMNIELRVEVDNSPELTDEDLEKVTERLEDYEFEERLIEVVRSQIPDVGKPLNPSVTIVL